MTEHTTYRDGYRVEARQVLAPVDRIAGRWSCVVVLAGEVVHSAGGETVEAVLEKANAWIDRHPGPQPELFEDDSD